MDCCLGIRPACFQTQQKELLFSAKFSNKEHKDQKRIAVFWYRTGSPTCTVFNIGRHSSVSWLIQRILSYIFYH